MADKVTKMHVSLKDVEPVTTFIKEIADLCHSELTADDLREQIQASCLKLNGGFGAQQDSDATALAMQRGWRFDPKDVQYRDTDSWPSVCIVIPVFNSPELLKQCLTSLMRTDYTGELMYTLVDNASTDPETLEILRTRDFDPIRFEEPAGFATAVNAGMKQVEADYYVLFNQDCRVTQEDWLTNLIKWMEHRPQCAIAGPKLIYPAGTIQQAGIQVPKGTIGRHRFAHYSADTPAANVIEKVQAVTGAVFAIKASAMGELGYLDEGFKFSCEDTAYCLRAGCLGWEVWYVPTSTVVHHESAIRRESKSERIREWTADSERRFHQLYGPFVDLSAEGTVALVVSDWVPASMSDALLNAGVTTTIYYTGDTAPQGTGLAEVQPVAELQSCSVLVVASAETVEACQSVQASRRYYLVSQSWDQTGDSYRKMEYDLLAANQGVIDKLAEIGRTSRAMGSLRDLLRVIAEAPV